MTQRSPAIQEPPEEPAQGPEGDTPGMTEEIAPASPPDRVPRPAAGSWTIGAYRPGFRAQMAALWRKRSILGFLYQRALLQIYRQAILGIGWLVIQPLAIAIPSAFVVGSVFGVSTAPVPLPLFILVGLSHWLLFRRCVQWMTKSIQMNSGLMHRFHIPGLLLHAAATAPAALEYLVIFCVTLAALGYYHVTDPAFAVTLGWHWFGILPALVLTIALAFGITCVSTILNAFARDTWLTLRYVLSVWMLVTPVLYPLEAVPEEHRLWLLLNPLTPIMELYRWSVLHQAPLPMLHLWIAAGVCLTALACGTVFFIRNEWRIAQ